MSTRLTLEQMKSLKNNNTKQQSRYQNRKSRVDFSKKRSFKKRRRKNFKWRSLYHKFRSPPGQGRSKNTDESLRNLKNLFK